MKNDNRLTEGGTLQVLLRFAAPFLAANILQALYGAVDLAVVGWFCSPESVAAVSTGAQVTQIITSVISGLTLGSTILVGRYIGENRYRHHIDGVRTLFSGAHRGHAGGTAAHAHRPADPRRRL